MHVVDNFNRADNSVLGTCSDGVYSWDEWRVSAYSFIKDNQCHQYRNSWASVYHTEAVIAEEKNIADLYVQCTVVGSRPCYGTRGGHLLARIQSAAGDTYIFLARTGSTADTITGINIILRSTGTLASKAYSTAVPLTIKGECNGESLKMYAAGVEELSTTDATLASGAFGLYGYVRASSLEGIAWDDFEAGDLAVPPAAPSIIWIDHVCDNDEPFRPEPQNNPPDGVAVGICNDCGTLGAPTDVLTTCAGAAGTNGCDCTGVNGSANCGYDNEGSVYVQYIGEVGGINGTDYPRHVVEFWCDGVDGEVVALAECSGSDWIQFGPEADDVDPCWHLGAISYTSDTGTCDGTSATFNIDDAVS